MENVKDFMIGGANSTFWMLRRQINSMSLDELSSLPFFSWQCLTLIMEDGLNVDLVIGDDREMDLLLKFLIRRLRTLDGKANSAQLLLTLLQQQEEKQERILTGRKHLLSHER